MVKKIIISTMLCLSMTACTPKVAVKEKIVEKDIPVYVVPKAPHVERPVLETSKLTLADRKDINKEAKALTITVEQLKDYSLSLEAIINKYNELSNTNVLITSFDPKTPALLNIDKLKEFLDKQAGK